MAAVTCLDGTSNNKYDQILILIEMFLYKHGQREKHKNPWSFLDISVTGYTSQPVIVTDCFIRSGKHAVISAAIHWQSLTIKLLNLKIEMNTHSQTLP